MTKIIGFLITKQKIKLDIDFFNVGFKLLELNYCNYHIYFWSIGEIENYKISDKYSLSFPLHDSLLSEDRL